MPFVELTCYKCGTRCREDVDLQRDLFVEKFGCPTCGHRMAACVGSRIAEDLLEDEAEVSAISEDDCQTK